MAYSSEEIREKLKAFTGWEYINGAIQKTYSFGEFTKSMEFVNKLAMVAENKHHHPDMLIQYGKVTVMTMTHDEDGITDKDFDLVKTVEQLVIDFV